MKFETKWESLPTKKLSSDSSYIYYSAETTGFSLFAITAEKKTVAVAGKAIEEPVLEQNLTENVSVKPKEEIQLSEQTIAENFAAEKPKGIPKIVWIFAGASIVAVLVTGFVLKGGKKDVLVEDFKNTLKHTKSAAEYYKLNRAYIWLSNKDKEKFYPKVKKLYEKLFVRS